MAWRKAEAPMRDWKHDLGLRAMKILNVALVTGCFAAVWYLYYARTMAVQYYARGDYAVIAVFAIAYILLARTYDAFQISYYPLYEMVYSQGLAVFIADGFMVLLMWLLSKHFPWLWPGIITLAAQLVLITLWSWAARHWYFRVFMPQKSVVVYDVREGMEKLIDEYGFNRKYKVTANIDVQTCLSDLSRLDGYKTVFLSGIHSHERNVILKYCVDKGIRVMVIPRIGDVVMSGAKRMHMFYLPMLKVERQSGTPEYLIIKRILDIVLSALALVIVSPFMLITAIAIKATDHGPVFYRQTRLTKDGKEFKILKFRSMRVDAEKDGVARLSTGDNDDRITPVGKIIRAIRMDEIPQLWNILVGEMSIVGPRPERPEIAAQYEQELPEFRLRLQVKAGLTGYAQVYGKYNTTPYDKLMMDLMYIAHPTIPQDLAIMFATVKILFMKESTEGIEKGQTTAGGTGDGKK